LLTKVPKNLGNRVARQEDCLFRRLFPTGPDKNRSSHQLPAGGDRTFGHLPLSSVSLPTLQRRPGPPSRSH